MALKLTLWVKKSTANCSQGPKIDSQSPNKLSREETPSKGTVFFFPRKSLRVLTHSFWAFFVFFSGFFFSAVFFFPGKVCSPLTRLNLQKQVKKAKNGIFCRFSVFPMFFFSGQFFFFPKKSLPATHSLVFRGRKKKQRRKKKTAFSLTQSKNHKKVQILNFSGKKNTVPLLLET